MLLAQMSLAGGYVRNEPNSTFGKPNVAAIVTPDRTLFVQADTADELAAWLEALTLECSGRATMSRAKPPPPPMPDILDIDGVSETAAELRVRAGGSLLDSLCVAWYRVAEGAEAPARAIDPAKCPGVT